MIRAAGSLLSGEPNRQSGAVQAPEGQYIFQPFRLPDRLGLVNFRLSLIRANLRKLMSLAARAVYVIVNIGGHSLPMAVRKRSSEWYYRLCRTAKLISDGTDYLVLLRSYSLGTSLTVPSKYPLWCMCR